jgi:hypothetical protein
LASWLYQAKCGDIAVNIAPSSPTAVPRSRRPTAYVNGTAKTPKISALKRSAKGLSPVIPIQGRISTVYKGPFHPCSAIILRSAGNKPCDCSTLDIKGVG